MWHLRYLRYLQNRILEPNQIPEHIYFIQMGYLMKPLLQHSCKHYYYVSLLRTDEWDT